MDKTIAEARADVRELFDPFGPAVDLLVEMAQGPLGSNEETALAVVFEVLDSRVTAGTLNEDKLAGLLTVAVVKLAQK